MQMLASVWTRRFSSWNLLSPILALALCAGAALAQTSQISGTVDDASKARIQGAAISLTHTETGERREVTSNADGYLFFRFFRQATTRSASRRRALKPRSDRGFKF